MSSPAGNTELMSAWDAQSTWTQTANRLRRALSGARAAVLFLTIASAALVTAGGQVTGFSSVTGKVFAGVAAGCASVAVALQTFISPSRVEDWMRARAVSEALKGEVYTYLAGTAPYRNADRASVFDQRVTDIVKQADDLAERAIGIEPVPRDLPAVSDVDTYIQIRMLDQIRKYYKPKSAEMKRRATILRTVEIALIGVAAVLSGITAVSGLSSWAAWLPVVTTASGAVAAEAAVRRYSGLAVEYGRAYGQLERLLRNRGADKPESAEGDDEFVRSAERVISLQNEAWMARGIAAAKAKAGG